MFLDQKNQYCQSDHTVQNSPQIHCDPYRITNDIYNYNLQLQIQNTITIYNYHFSQN